MKIFSLESGYSVGSTTLSKWKKGENTLQCQRAHSSFPLRYNQMQNVHTGVFVY